MAKGKVTFYEGKQTGMVIRREEKDKSEIQSAAGASNVKEMSAAEKIKFAGKAKAQEAERKRKNK